MEKQERIKELIAELESLDVVAERRKDLTKGIIGEVKQDFSSLSEQGFVLEKADFGRGFQFYKDYSKDTSGKLKRLVR